jgi:hypothetical protein
MSIIYAIFVSSRFTVITKVMVIFRECIVLAFIYILLNTIVNFALEIK